MGRFSAANVAGYGREQDFDPANLILDWVRTSWTLSDPAPYDADTNPYGILFGLDYVGNHDLVAYASNMLGHTPTSLSLGGRLEAQVVDVSFCFVIRRHNVVAGEQIPAEITRVMKYLENVIDSNPRALHEQGVQLMDLVTYNTGEKEIYNQQCWQLELVIRCYYLRINV